MTPASKVGENSKTCATESHKWPEWQIRVMEELLLREGFPAHRVREKSIQILDWAAMTFVEREVDRAMYGEPMGEPIGIMGQYKGAGDEP